MTFATSSFASSIQFVSAVVLLVTASVVNAYGNTQAAQDKQSNPMNKSRASSDSNGESSGQYTLKPRLVLWMRQMLLTAYWCVNIYALWTSTPPEEHSQEHASLLGDRAWYYFAHVAFIVAIAVTLLVDNIDNLYNTVALKAWLVVYTALVLHAIVLYTLASTATACILLVLCVLVLVVAIVCAFVDLSRPQINPPTFEYTCGLLAALAFSHINKVLILPGMKKLSFEFDDDVPGLSDLDSSHEVWKRFRKILLSSKELNLWYSLYQLVKWEWFAQGFFQFMGSTATYITPLALERILLHVANHGRDDDDIKTLVPISVTLAVVLLFVGPMLSCIGDNQNYVRGRHIGIRVKAALIAAIYNKALSVDLSASKESIGKLNNLISVDVGDIQTFCCYSHLMWSTLMEILMSSTLLYIVLGRAAFGGLLIMIFSLGVGMLVSKLVEHFQEQLLKCKDARMGVISEVLNSMRVIKYYAWERKFTSKIRAARTTELRKLRNYAVTNATLYSIWEIVPAVVGAAAFVLHTYFLGQTLTPSTGFTALTLFNLLRFPLDCFPDMMNFFVRTKISLRRIEAFLRTPDVKGITDACAAEDSMGSSLDGSDSQYSDHVFAPKAYKERGTTSALKSVPLSAVKRDASDSTRYIPDSHAHNTLAGAQAGSVRLTSLTLAWAPTLKEDTQEDDDKRPAAASAGYCGCLTRRDAISTSTISTGTVPSSSISAGGIIINTVANKLSRTKAQKYELVSNQDDKSSEDSTHGPLDASDINNPSSVDSLSAAIEANNTEHEIHMLEVEKWRGNNRSSMVAAPIASNNQPDIPKFSRSRSSSVEVKYVPDGRAKPTVILKRSNIAIPPGALTVVVGVTGSGKSSLLQGALLGEALHLSGSVSVGGNISYASQSPWIQNATLRDNVLFGTPYDQERYDKVVFSCALLSDFKLLPAGDMTEIGEKGVNLSGGQQQRVSLARAAYAYSDVILLDDPLSAVDALVGEHIFKELVLGFLKDRTRILVTHNMSLAVASADLVICLHSCEISPADASNPNQPRSQVVACCAPNELQGVIQKLKAKSTRNSDLSVFLEGLIAAAALASKDVPSGDRTTPSVRQPSQNASPVSEGTSSESATSTHGAQKALSTPQKSPNAASASLTAAALQALDAANGQQQPTKQGLRPNFSYESLRQGFNSILSTSPTKEKTTNAAPLSTGKVLSAQTVSDGKCSGPDGAASSGSTTQQNGTATAGGKDGSTIVDKEGKSVGRVGWQVYWFYFKACGGVRAVMGIVGGSALCSLAWLFQNISLGEWMTAMENDGLGRSKGAFRVYAVSVGLVMCATIFRAFTQVTSNLTSANHLHERLLQSVMSAPCGWFDATPVGRIVNRFSQDVSTVDSSIINNMYGFVDRLLATTQIVGVICISLPLLMLPLLPIVLFTWWVSRQYLHVSRELKRLESLKKSPVFVLFSETLQGLPVVRAFRAEGRFFKTCCDRINDMNRCHIYLWIANRWLAFRMQLLGAMVAGAVGLAVVLESDRIGSTVAGIVLIYSLSFCEALTFLARAHADCQMDLNSIERIQEYSSLTPEKGLSTDLDSTLQPGDEEEPYIEMPVLGKSRATASTGAGEDRDSMDASSHPLMLSGSTTSSALHSAGSIGISAAWPSLGRVEFRNISLKYNSCATPVLRDVSFTIAGKTKLGVVGRTGAGKSSLIAALFRIVEPCAGQLFIDDVNVLDISLHTLRNNVAIVPQDPTLFRGSVRFNLDPFQQHTDEELWAALKSAHLAEHVYNMHSEPVGISGNGSGHNVGFSTGGSSPRSPRSPSSVQGSSSGVSSSTVRFSGSLEDKLVAEKGANFSLGQRQLLCMARAILRKASVLVLDECTASVDHETDALIQETVRQELSDCTVICIAHRLHTIAYYDNVLVMDQGRVAEYAEPFELINREGSIFRQMCVTSGDFDELYASAEQAHNARLACASK